MEAIPTSETSVLTRATRHHIPETAFFIVTAVKTLNLTTPVMFPTDNTIYYLIFFSRPYMKLPYNNRNDGKAVPVLN
jgi:hypothetical protein